MRLNVLAAALCLSITALSAAPPADAAIRKATSIPAQNLGSALVTLEKDRNFQVIFISEDIRSLQTQGASGQLTFEEALRELLEGTGLTYRYLDQNTVTVLPTSRTAAPFGSASSGLSVFDLDSTQASGTVSADTAFIRLAQSENVSTQNSADAQSTPNGKPEASDDTSSSLVEIIVTATRRALGAQSVPLALTAVGADQLRNSGVTSAADLARVAPNLYVLGSAVSAGSPRFTLRGLTGTDLLPTSSPAVATYIDDVYQASQFAITSGLFDLQRVEILRGPQGTTFGKNTTGGAVAYFSETPTDEFEGYVTARGAAGDRPERFLEGAVNLPLVDTLAMRTSFRVEDKDSYMRDLASGRERGDAATQSGRVQLRWTPEDTVVNLTLSRSRHRGDTNLGHAQFVPAPVDKDTVDFNAYDLYDDYDNTAATLRIERNLGLFDLTSISHYRMSKIAQAQDLDATSFDFFYYYSHVRAQQYGQEIRFASDASQPVSGLFGLYFEKDKLQEDETEATTFNGAAGDFNNPGAYTTYTKTYAAFANLTVKLTDALSVTGGLRKSIEKKEQDGLKYYFQTGQYDWSEDNVFFPGAPPVAPDQTLTWGLQQKSEPWTWDATINYNPAHALLIFARAAHGFRSGGFNAPNALFPESITGFPFSPAPPPESFDGETVQSYELGVKTNWLDNTLSVNATAYHYDYRDQQVSVFSQGFILTSNAGASKVNGVEAELWAKPTDRLDLAVSASYNDAQYLRYSDPFTGADYSGNSLIQAPKLSANLSANYVIPLNATFDLRAGTTWSYRSELFFDSANSSIMRAGDLVTGNIRLALEPTSGAGPSVGAFVNNVTGERALANGFQFFGNQYGKFFDTGILYGVDVSYRW